MLLALVCKAASVRLDCLHAGVGEDVKAAMFDVRVNVAIVQVVCVAVECNLEIGRAHV